MTSDIAQTEEKPATSAPLPPVEVETAPHALVEERPVAAPASAFQPNNSPSPAAQDQTAPHVPVTGLSLWLSRHRTFTKKPLSYLGYQFVRASFAVIPYGFGMAAGHHLFNSMSAVGQKMGLTEKGVEAFTEGTKIIKGGVETTVKGLAAVDGIAKFEAAGARGVFGRNLMRVGTSPLNSAVQIALGFTLFRFTGGLVKNLRDRVMNEKNTPEQTQAEVQHAGKTMLEAAKINWPAEVTGTPIAALALGYMNGSCVPTAIPFKRDLVKYEKGLVGFAKQAKDVIFSKPAKLLQQAATWTISYSIFFLLAESLFKDKQIQRGHWKGHPNSLKNGPDDTVGGPGAVSFTPPESFSDGPPPKPVKTEKLFGAAEEGYKQEDDRAHDSHEKLRYPWLTAEPSMGRFLIRRVAPVAVGITAYAALKRVGYLIDVPFAGIKGIVPGVKGLTGQMEGISVGKLEELNTAATALGKVGNHAKFFVKNAYREGKATIMFGALWASTDAWGSFYDKFVHKLQKPENAVPLNEHQQAKHEELLARLNAKEQNAGRAA